ncbi:MAG TPA: tail fiber protein [Acidiphilium sp.]|nr:MAG: hypothetical protein B7Z68_00745 [Acidobacteria bacterium 21-70-11]HQU24986.1 tail fiber protein [Acidiphilium sp.]
MAEPITSNKGYTIPNTGDLVNTWGPVVNANFALLDALQGGTGSLTVSSGTYALSTSAAQNLRILVSGFLAGAVTITISQKPGYFYFHDTTSRNGYPITVTTGSTTGRTQNLPARMGHLFSDGANVYLVTEPNHGEMKPHAAPGLPPPLWMYAYGQEVSRITYADLFAAIGTAWGAGDGSTTFNVPDMRGRAAFGGDSMGGTAAGRITTASLPIGGAFTSVGGHELLQSHSHTDAGHTHTDAGHNHGASDSGHTHSDAGHGHGAGDNGHAHSDAGHQHTQANGIYASSSGQISGGTIFGGAGTPATAVSYANIQTGHASVYVSTGYANIQTGYANISVQTGHASIQTNFANIQSSGGGNAQNMPPALVTNYIIYAGQ